MKTYKVLKGNIKGVPAGFEVQLSDNDAKLYGKNYVKEVKTEKKSTKKETKKENKKEYSDKQVKKSKKTK